MNNSNQQQTQVSQILKHAELLEHWQGHRSLTRKVIEAFPEQELFTYSLGGMRPFADMVVEFLSMGAPGLKGIVNNQWEDFKEQVDHQKSKARLLEYWDQATREINEYWQQIPEERFQENILAFNQYEGSVISTIFYFIDNEIHHRGQGYVYLRTLKIEPPYFWER